MVNDGSSEEKRVIAGRSEQSSEGVRYVRETESTSKIHNNVAD